MSCRTATELRLQCPDTADLCACAGQGDASTLSAVSGESVIAAPRAALLVRVAVLPVRLHPAESLQARQDGMNRPAGQIGDLPDLQAVLGPCRLVQECPENQLRRQRQSGGSTLAHGSTLPSP